MNSFVIFLYILALSICNGQDTKSCVKNCKYINAPVCGSDGRTYGSICWLELSACQAKRTVKVACNGLCPCKENYVNQKLSDQLLKQVSQRSNGNMLEYLKSHQILKETITFGKCPLQEMTELPARLIDWFHVLKINQKQQEFDDQKIEGEEVLPRVKFVETKMKAMYSKLACVPQKNVQIAKLVCLEPVKWMFNELDSDHNNALSIEELRDIEHINNENCIKPFLEKCDTNDNGYVILQEFCSCLCTTSPCTKAIQDVPTVIVRNEPRPIGKFIPTCDEDGFFAPMQCNVKNDCWCVDRNGAELKGSRRTGEITCETITQNQNPEDLIALDMRKENE